MEPGTRALPSWFDDAKLGIFVHWTAASVPAFAPVTESPSAVVELDVTPAAGAEVRLLGHDAALVWRPAVTGCEVTLPVWPAEAPALALRLSSVAYRRHPSGAVRSSDVLIARDLWVSHGPQVVLGGVSVAVNPGARLGVVGPNGIGKSTLLRALAGIVRPDAGRRGTQPRDHHGRLPSAGAGRPARRATARLPGPPHRRGRGQRRPRRGDGGAGRG